MKKVCEPDRFVQVTRKVSIVCMLSNLGLCVLKMVGGFLASSEALISDGINSAFDVISGFVVLIGARLSRRQADEEHPYGHERIESVTAIVLAMILFVTAVFLGSGTVADLVSGAYRSREIPGMFAMIVAVIAVAVKEILFWYTNGNARKINSVVLKAAAWDHRADVISTSGAFIGVLVSRLGFPEGDLLASILVCLFIIRTAYKVFREAVGQMVDRSCDEEMLAQLRKCILAVEGVLGIDMLQVRMFGNRYYVDLEIKEEGTVSLTEAHKVAEEVHDSIETEFPSVKHIMVHVNPTDEQNEGENNAV